LVRATDNMDKLRTRALEIGIYLPLGAYSKVRDQITDLDAAGLRKLYSDLVGRGQQRMQPMERAVRRRSARVERRVQESAGTVASRTRREATKTARRAEAAASATAPKMPRVAAPTDASKLPIGRYDSLTADEIAQRTRGLTQTDLAKVYKYEKANQNRATVLEMIESKFIDLPIPTYDALTVEEIDSRLSRLSKVELKRLRRYEESTKARSTVIQRIDSRIA
jgi:hypothetical protein